MITFNQFKESVFDLYEGLTKGRKTINPSIYSSWGIIKKFFWSLKNWNTLNKNKVDFNNLPKGCYISISYEYYIPVKIGLQGAHSDRIITGFFKKYDGKYLWIDEVVKRGGGSTNGDLTGIEPKEGFHYYIK